MGSGEVRVGVSGWQYASWRGDFYPRGLRQREELAYLAARTTALELNGSFRSLLRPATYRRLRDETPDDFRVAVKGSRYISHTRRLRDVDTALANFLASGVLALGEKLGPLLWQLPPDLQYDEEQVSAFLSLLPRDTAAAARLARGHDDKVPEDRALTEAPWSGSVRHAVEVRHPSFATAAAVACLADHDVSLVVSDSPGRWPLLEERTSDFVHVRLHGHTELYASGYAPRSLDRWADKVHGWAADGADVLVFFDNDARGRAPHDAVALLARLS